MISKIAIAAILSTAVIAPGLAQATTQDMLVMRRVIGPPVEPQQSYPDDSDGESDSDNRDNDGNSGQPSAPTYKWTYGEWGNWDSTCSPTASRTRNVECVSEGSVVDNSLCSAPDMPDVAETGPVSSGCTEYLLNGSFDAVIVPGDAYYGGLDHWSAEGDVRMYRATNGPTWPRLYAGASVSQTTWAPLDAGATYMLEYSFANSTGGSSNYSPNRTTITSSTGAVLLDIDFPKTTRYTVKREFVADGGSVTVRTESTTRAIMVDEYSITRK